MSTVNNGIPGCTVSLYGYGGGGVENMISGPLHLSMFSGETYHALQSLPMALPASVLDTALSTSLKMKHLSLCGCRGKTLPNALHCSVRNSCSI
jgi:hypothetical protein